MKSNIKFLKSKVNYNVKSVNKYLNAKHVKKL